jgi:ubiquinone/menaquinone biosynthesis C-methylase UbiE
VVFERGTDNGSPRGGRSLESGQAPSDPASRPLGADEAHGLSKGAELVSRPSGHTSRVAESSADSPTRQDWEDLGRIDAEWAILSDPDKRLGGWDSDAFFATGEGEVRTVMDRAEERGLLTRREQALDVGCGIGRLSAALLDYFEEVVGVDISDAMLTRAREVHADRAGLSFEQASADDLRILEPASFDFALTRLVLQHLPSEEAILRAFGEMLRVLRPGGLLVAQTTSELPLRHRLQPRPRLYRALRRAGVPAEVLYRRLHLQPVRMTIASTDAVQKLLSEYGAILHATEREPKNAGAVWTTYWVTR